MSEAADTQVEQSTTTANAAAGSFAPIALGPIFVGRLDGVVAPLILVALVVATTRPRLAVAVATAGAWIKIAPGAVVVALAATRRELEREEAALARRARMEGFAWQAIADALGVSRQAVHKKHGKR